MGILGFELAFVGLEFFDDIVDVAVEGSRDTTAAVADAVVGDAILGEVVGADLFTAVTGADQGAAFAG